MDKLKLKNMWPLITTLYIVFMDLSVFTIILPIFKRNNLIRLEAIEFNFGSWFSIVYL